MMATSGMVTAALLQPPQQLPFQVLLLLLPGIFHKALRLSLLMHTQTLHLHASYAALSAAMSLVEVQNLIQMLKISYSSAGRCCY